MLNSVLSYWEKSAHYVTYPLSLFGVIPADVRGPAELVWPMIGSKPGDVAVSLEVIC